MANWSGGVLTTKGQALQAKVDAGQTTLTLTKMKIGSGVLADGQSLEALTDLISPQQNISISGISASDNVTTITGVVTNSGLTAGFYVRELGVFATDPDDGEILYSATTDSAPDYLPEAGSSVTVSQEFNYYIAVSNTSTVSATLSTSGLVTVGMLQSHTHDGTGSNGPQLGSDGLENGAATDLIIGNRTITDTTTAATGANTLTNLLSMLGYMIKSVTGKSAWYTAPATTLQTLNDLIVSTAAANKLLKLNSSGALPTDITGNAATATNATSHIANTAGAHAATAISCTATGDVAATTVQAAIAELASDKAANAHSSSATTYGISTASVYGHAMASAATPLVAGTAAIGTDNGKFAREGHVHPAQTTITGNAATATTATSATTATTCSGNAATATILATARTINGVSFDGSANITVADSTKAPIDHASTATTYGIASATEYGHAMASAATPLIAGTAAVGTDNGKFAREGHVHPVQTTITGNAATATNATTHIAATAAAHDASAITNTASGTISATTVQAALNELGTEKAALAGAAFTGAVTMASTLGVTGAITAAGGVVGALTGNAATATKLATARTITLSGDVTGSGSFDGSANLSITTTSNSSPSYAIITDEKTSGTSGGSGTASTWNTRDLNTIKVDTDSIVTLSSNQFTLQSGTYLIEAVAPVYAAGNNRTRLQNITDSTTIAYGNNCLTSTGTYANGASSTLYAKFTISAAKVFELQHWIQSAAGGSSVLGALCGITGVVETYSIVKITKI
ncbi:hypothetical protein SPSIL_009160 [Sporomusa silvacetica DSM 10669]|uniref:Phage tail fibre protein N-terminal domain-containing protein n=1 Tax=Sporomusa silvacetica DSM 10669 TaxID=1123289 RepID=A0ABZ3IGK1_9FIRM|nr:phage tail protein [Sporomusa silvacetica]OZC13124.1 hypothetical protein SPSIL_55800 [Sporomusa silvacetica DSM 10669]